ncbi:hypothetical protein CVV67_05185 [Arthrobacter stackebrandtii]|nr:hypothetical protein CVV67_05185 [Arthrobacter stackebrandtii]
MAEIIGLTSILARSYSAEVLLAAAMAEIIGLTSILARSYSAEVLLAAAMAEIIGLTSILARSYSAEVLLAAALRVRGGADGRGEISSELSWDAITPFCLIVAT